VAILEEDVARVRAATDIVALIGEHTGLKRSGRKFVGLCPFHEEKTGSFQVNSEEGLYYCFGCRASGDAITFVREKEHLDFVEAVRRLADRAGITITEDAAATADNRRRAPIYKVVSDAVDWYHERLISAPDAGAARDYLRSRGYDGETVRRFKLGWAPDEWDALARELKVGAKLFTDSGLGFVNRAGRQQDQFRARVLFPIFDPSGKALAIGGRVLPAGQASAPKYKNSPETAVYSKRRVLYGLNWAKSDVISSGEVIVCEGYTDVIGFFSAGLPRAVATCGTALGEDHFRMLSNFASGRMVLAYDADSAGQAGASRVYTWERQHKVDVAVADLPPGSDPGELARTDPEALREAVSKAKSFLTFRIDRIFGSANLKTAEGRAKAADSALGAVLEHPNPLVRDQYLMQIADRCRVEPAALRERMEVLEKSPENPEKERGDQGRPKGTTIRSGSDRAGSQDRQGRATVKHDGPRPGLDALRLAIHDPESIEDRLERILFVDDLQTRAFDALASAETVIKAIDMVEDDDPDVAELLRRLAVEEPTVNADECVVQLVRTAARRSFSAIEAEARLDPDRFESLSAVSGKVPLDLELIDTSEAGLEAADRLLAWLRTREIRA
jgi:DNA primase